MALLSGARLVYLVYRLRYALDDPGFESQHGNEISFSSLQRRYQPPVRRVPGSFPGVKRPGRKADHSPRPSADDTNDWSYTSTPPVTLHDVGTENFPSFHAFNVRQRSHVGS